MKGIFTKIKDAIRRHPVAIVTWVVILVGWEIAAHLAPASTIKGSPLVPSWEFVFTDALKQLSGNWTLPYWAPNPIHGGEETYLGAFLAIGYHSATSLIRLLLGLASGVVAGVGSALLISYWPWARQIAWTPLNLLRMVPLLAAIPLFQFWLGANTVGTTAFIGFGVWVVLMVATINAVNNVPDRYIESARTLGASRLRTYLRVIVPAALPELRTSLLLAAGLSWSLTVGSEYIGLQDGLGKILAVAEFFTNTGRMIIVAVLITFYALLTFFVLDRLFRRLTSWVPTLDEGVAVTTVAGAAAVGAPEVTAIPAQEGVGARVAR
jgi:sulfonate transport system permease protein